MTAQEILQRLKKQKVSKWKVKVITGVSWQTVHMWDKGLFKPTKNNMDKLVEMARSEGII